MPNDPDQLAKRIDEIAAELRQLPACGDWIDAFTSHDAISSDEAAFIAGCSAQTIRRRATEAAEIGQPIGISFASAGLVVSKTGLLPSIYNHQSPSRRPSAG